VSFETQHSFAARLVGSRRLVGYRTEPSSGIDVLVFEFGTYLSVEYLENNCDRRDRPYASGSGKRRPSSRGKPVLSAGAEAASAPAPAAGPASHLQRNPLECWAVPHFQQPIVAGGLPIGHVL